MCHGYRTADREVLREFEEEREETAEEELAEPETDLEESEREPPLPTADD